MKGIAQRYVGDEFRFCAAKRLCLLFSPPDIISLIEGKVGISMKLDSNNHSVFLLYYHLVLVVKYRRNVFDDDMSDYAKDMFVRLSENYNITLVEWNHDVDHVHILFKAHPNTEMTKFINAYKSASS